MSFLFSLNDKKGRSIYALADGLPKRGLLKILGDAASSAGIDPAALEERRDLACPIIYADTAVDGLRKFQARGLKSSTLTCEPALEAELKGEGVPVAPWNAETAATYALYLDCVHNPAKIGGDNLFSWELYRAWFGLGHAEGPLLKGLSKFEIGHAEGIDATSLPGWTLWGNEGKSLSQPYSVNCAIHMSQGEFHYFPSSEDTHAFLTGEVPKSQAILTFEPQPDPDDDSELSSKAHSIFGTTIPTIKVFEGRQNQPPTLALWRIITLSITGLAALLDHPFPEGLPPGPMAKMKRKFGNYEDEIEVYLFPPAAVAQFLIPEVSS